MLCRYSARCVRSATAGVRLCHAAGGPAGNTRRHVRRPPPASAFMPVLEEPMEFEGSKFLRVAVVGPPNAGKSVLVNRLVGTKVSAVSPKCNTTRQRVLGVLSQGDTQVCFTDTPGVVDRAETGRYFKPLVTAAQESIPVCDLTLLILDAAKRPDDHYRAVIGDVVSMVHSHEQPLWLVLNKVDLVRPKTWLLSRGEEVHQIAQDRAPHVRKPFDSVFTLSALHDDGVDALLHNLLQRARPGPWLFPADVKTDMSLVGRVTEVIREQLYKLLHKELPYAVVQQNVAWNELADGTLRVEQDLWVDRESQKRTLEGKLLGVIGARARDELQHALGQNVKLSLHVKVKGKSFRTAETE